MTQTGNRGLLAFTASPQNLILHGPGWLRGQPPVQILFDGRPVATFRAERFSNDAETGTYTLVWPEALQTRLRGWCDVSVIAGESAAHQHVRFGSAATHLDLADPMTGRPLVLNKWDRLSRSFQDLPGELFESLLDAAEQLISDVRQSMGLDLFLVGGSLLGAVREGHLMVKDDDLDLAYLSTYRNPTDIVLEGYRLERRLRALGYNLVRPTAGHLQIMFPGGTMADEYYIDIFTYFTTNDWLYGTFQVREPAQEVPILPLKNIAVNGRLLAAPADPESLLRATYGPGWRVPDPTFKFVTPPAAGRRYYAWLNHLDVDRENWEDEHRRLIASGSQGEASTFAQLVSQDLPPRSQVIELGCGTGADAVYMANGGHDVLATDYSRPALLHLSNAAPNVGPGRLHVRAANLYSIREMAGLLSHIDPGRPSHFFSRRVFDSVHRLAWENAALFFKHALKGPGTAYVELSRHPAPTPGGIPMQESGPIDLDDLRKLLNAAGLFVESWDAPGISAAPSITRLIISKSRRSQWT